jgi:hypothetical protein
VELHCGSVGEKRSAVRWGGGFYSRGRMQQVGCAVATSWRGDHDDGEHGEASLGQH